MIPENRRYIRHTQLLSGRTGAVSREWFSFPLSTRRLVNKCVRQTTQQVARLVWIQDSCATGQARTPHTIDGVYLHMYMPTSDITNADNGFIYLQGRDDDDDHSTFIVSRHPPPIARIDRRRTKHRPGSPQELAPTSIGRYMSIEDQVRTYGK